LRCVGRLWLTWFIVGSGAAADRQGAAGGEPERLGRGDVEGGEQLRVGEQVAHARHLATGDGGGAVHGRAARVGGVLVGRLEVRRARQQLFQAREQVLRRQPVRGARGAADGRGGPPGDDDGDKPEERGGVAHRLAQDSERSRGASDGAGFWELDLLDAQRLTW
jgi:hypothetical protein